MRWAYRDLLREGRPAVRFLHVRLPERVIADHVEHPEGHYLPASMLPSQLATLQPLEPGGGSETKVLASAPDALGLRPPV